MDLRTRQWASFEYVDPVPILQHLRAVELELNDLPPHFVEISDRARRLRTNELRSAREARDAALFAHGMAQLVGTKVYYAPVEEADYDFVSMYVVDDTQHFTPVQLKEVPPSDLSANVSLTSVIAGLEKYTHSDTVLAINYNRRQRLDLSELELPEVPFAKIWVFGCTSPDHSSWVLMGDFRSEPQQIEFAYPTLEGLGPAGP
jgi:hypothetical protein